MKATVSLFVTAGLVLCGCSTFNREWREAAKDPLPTNGITGRWQGHWASAVNGHHGDLRALVTSADANHCDVRFRAAYKKWVTVHFGYTVRMEVVPATNGMVRFRGREDLGWLAGGTYTYEGHATPTDFFSTYDSKHDHGTFQMKRPD
jgi:hypothetical protein